MYDYRVVVSQNSGCGDTSDVTTVTVIPDPVVTISSDVTEVCDQGTAILTSDVTGGTGTISYEWQSQITGIGWIQIPGATNDTYSTMQLTVGSHVYRVLISQDSGCEDTSNVLTITSVENPVASISTDDANICIGGTALLTASIIGGAGDPTYLWQSFVAGFGWVDIPGAVESTYETATLTTPDDYDYRVIIGQNSGCGDTSDIMTVTVVPDPTVLVTIAPAEICSDGTALLTAIVSGGAGSPFYQWQREVLTDVWVDIPGADQSTYTTLSLTEGVYQYRVIVSQSSGCGVTSGTTTVTVEPDPTVIVSIVPPEICEDGSALLSAIVSGGAGDTYYQWQFEVAPNVWTDVPGANQSTYTTESFSQGTYNYRVSISQNSGCGVISDLLTLNIVTDPEVDVTTVPDEICENGTAMLTAIVTGGSGLNFYQWQIEPAPGVWVDIPGENLSTFSTSGLTIGTYNYRVLVSQNAGCNVVSSTTTITVVENPTVTVTADVTIVCDEGSAELTADVMGGAGTTSYQWQIEPAPGVWIDIPGANQPTLLAQNLSVGSYEYRVVVSQTSGCEVTSDPTTITVVADPVVDVTIVPEDICDDGTALLTSTVTGGTGFTNYQWQREIVENVWFDIPGANSETYATTTLTTGSYDYRLIINQSSGCGDTSNIATVSVLDDPVVTVTSDALEICANGSALLTADVTGGAGASNYQWQVNHPILLWIDIPGETQPSFTASNLNLGPHEYRVILTQNSGCEDTSNVVIITVVADPEVTVTSDDPEICSGGTALLVADVDGGTAITNYQWQFEVTDNIWANIPGAMSPTYQTVSLNDPGIYEYRVIITQNSGCVDTSEIYSVTVVDDASVSISLNNPEVCIDGLAEFTANVIGGSGNLTYQWQDSISGNTWTDISNATNVNYSAPTSIAGLTYYRVVITDPNSGCADPTSSNLSLLVVEDPIVDVEINNPEVCIGGDAQLSATVIGGSSSISYQWQDSISGGAWSDISGATDLIYLAPTTTAGIIYYQIL
jgi:hypothetical protein